MTRNDKWMELDFNQRFMLAHGTHSEYTCDTVEEVFAILKTMDSMDRHFCKIYDHANGGRITDGCNASWCKEWNNRENAQPFETADIWHKW